MIVIKKLIIPILIIGAILKAGSTVAKGATDAAAELTTTADNMWERVFGLVVVGGSILVLIEILKLIFL